MKTYKVADIVFEAGFRYKYSSLILKDYEYFGNEPCAFSIVLTQEDVERERKGVSTMPDAYLESLALFRKICEYVLVNGKGLVFHCSAVAVDGEAYLFTAPSGTGKSTHTRLWREMLGEKAVMVNDDKPIIRCVDGEFYVYGTPWRGKHELGCNTRAKIKAICNIYQSKENVITTATVPSMLGVILNQTVRPTALVEMDALLSSIAQLLSSVKLYRLGCNISREAAELSYTTMSGEKL